MTFSEIEELVGELPASKRYPAWWSNNPSNNPLTQVWLDCGFRTEQVNVEGGKLTFRNHAKMAREFDELARERGLDPPLGLAEDAEEFHVIEAMPLARHPLIGSMKGTFTIDPGWDLTKPALDPDELAEWEANLERKAGLIEQGPEGKKS